MLVVSLSDFANNPQKYTDSPVRLENNGVHLGTFTPSNRHFFLQKIIEPVMDFFKLGKRKIGPLEGKIKLEFVGDWEISPEELFEDMDDLRLCKTP